MESSPLLAPSNLSLGNLHHLEMSYNDDHSSNSSQRIQERRPPVYNAEDYVAGMKKFCKLTGLQMYLSDISNESNDFHDNKTNGDDEENNNSEEVGEMGLRQFSSVSELLGKLRADLSSAFPSFIREFIGDPYDGVTLLLDVLKAIQSSQTNISGSLNQLGSRANHVMFKRALNDEFETLMCLKICSRSEDGALKLVAHPSGLFTISVCVMSNFSKSRVLSLQLLARLCDDATVNGHRQVSDAMSMLRLRFGEPVRFKFLIGMLNSYNSSTFQVSCMKFLNRFVETSTDMREKIMIQTELEEAGMDLLILSKFLLNDEDDKIPILKEEISRWQQNYVDVNSLVRKLLDSERNSRKYREELSSIRDQLRDSENERHKLLIMLEKVKMKCERLEAEAKVNSCLGCKCNEQKVVQFPEKEVDENKTVVNHARMFEDECSPFKSQVDHQKEFKLSQSYLSGSSGDSGLSLIENEGKRRKNFARREIKVGSDGGSRNSSSSCSDSSSRGHSVSPQLGGGSKKNKPVIIGDLVNDDEFIVIPSSSMIKDLSEDDDEVKDDKKENVGNIYERNVMLEEETTSGAEKISIGKFKEKFSPPVVRKEYETDEQEAEVGCLFLQYLTMPTERSRLWLIFLFFRQLPTCMIMWLATILKNHHRLFVIIHHLRHPLDLICHHQNLFVFPLQVTLNHRLFQASWVTMGITTHQDHILDRLRGQDRPPFLAIQM